MKRRAKWMISAVAAAILSMGAASAAMAEGDVLTIEFFQQKGEEGPQKGYQVLIDKFNEENPDIKIEMNTVPDAPTVLTSRVASGDIPVIFSDFPTQTQFKLKVESGYVQDLSDQEFLQNAEAGSLAMTMQPDGKYYALPYTRNYMGVFYNIDMFNEYGLSVPSTWDEFLAVCDTLQENGIIPMGMNGKDPGRVGHLFQTATVAWTEHGVETIGAAVAGEAKIEGDEGFTAMFEKMATLLSYANEDALALSDTNCYENFANGQYAMCITGSYAKGTIEALNSELNLGVFPLPNDTVETTKCLAGMDISLCVSALASDEEKEAAYRFLAFMAQPENAQTFLNYDGAPSAIIGVASEDEGVAPISEILASGKTHDWMASTISNNVIQDLYSVVQGFWADKDVDAVLKNMDASIAVTSVQ
ncbi:MAG: extracellular solute-binding protein [Candidatus Limivivens sp.]|nr:extracellular solute-binding protein [Candidatus Limivivens sp.]